MRPARTDVHDGLAYALWLPEPAQRAVSGGVVVLHGAGSCKESHYDFARAAIAVGLAALTFDQRGHGQSDGPMDGRAIDDVIAMASLLRLELGTPDAPVVLRGSSMGGYLALRCAERVDAAAVVAICPASASGLRRALNDGSLRFDADRAAFGALLDGGELQPVVAQLPMAILLLHAQGDEQVPVQHSRELATVLRAPTSRLIELPGGHHRSIQHDDELQAISLRFVEKALGLR
jgi:alpha-beta hydrolase superfamily lysophospholipase